MEVCDFRATIGGTKSLVFCFAQLSWAKQKFLFRDAGARIPQENSRSRRSKITNRNKVSIGMVGKFYRLLVLLG